MSRRELLIALALAVACDAKKTAPPADVVVPADVAAPPIADAAPPITVADAASEDAGLADACAAEAESAPVSGKSIGHTSVVFKVELANGTKVAWKPNARKRKGRYRSEIAAYRLAIALGVPNVPPACLRTFDALDVARALAKSEAASKVFSEDVIIVAGKVHGAVIPWIEGLGFWAIEKDPERAEVRKWLTKGGEVPAEKTDLARQVSTMIAFDFLTANWDRYSGGNVGLDSTGKAVLYIDNDAALMESVDAARVEPTRVLVGSTDRWSKGFMAKVRTFNEDRLAAAFGDEEPGKPLLPRPVVAAVAKRVRELMTAIDGKVAWNGAAETLFFP